MPIAIDRLVVITLAAFVSTTVSNAAPDDPDDHPAGTWVRQSPRDGAPARGQPSSPVWYGHRYEGFSAGEWHQ